MIDGRILFIAGIYHITGHFSHLPSFVRQFRGRFDDLPFDALSVRGAIQDIIQERTQRGGKIDDSRALDLMLVSDLRRVAAVLDDKAVEASIAKMVNYQDTLAECRDRAIALLDALDVPVPPVEIFLVDELPEPYHSGGYSAVNTDEGDRKEHGIAPGMYFLKSDVRPFYSHFILLHELAHSVLGEKSPELFGRGLEEGLAELIGALYLSGSILGKELTTNLFIYNRLSHDHSQFWEIYLDYTRQAVYLYHRFGMDGLVSLLVHGRSAVKDVEFKCLSNKLSDINLPRGHWNPMLDELVGYPLLGFGRNLVVSPLAKYLAPYVRPGKTATEILTEADAEMTAGRKALMELQERVSVAHYRADGSVVTIADTDFLSEGPILRYEIPA